MHFFATNTFFAITVLVLLNPKPCCYIIVCEKIQLKGFIIIIALCVFSEVIFIAIIPSKEVARRNRRKSKNKAYYEVHKDDIFLNKRKTTAVKTDHSAILMNITNM